mgnify:CR=1 FL=1
METPELEGLEPDSLASLEERIRKTVEHVAKLRAERDDAVAQRELALTEKEEALAKLDQALTERDQALAERNVARKTAGSVADELPKMQIGRAHV